MPSKKIFSTLFYETKLNSTFFKKLSPVLIQNIYALEKIDKAGIKWSQEKYQGGYTSYGSITDLHKKFSPFEKLELLIRKHVMQFSKELGFKKLDLEMTTIWASIMRKGTYHPMHIHPKSVISGTVYLDIPKGASEFKIEDPRLSRMMASPARQLSNETHPYIVKHPKNADLYLFESWLSHEVPPQLVDVDRVTVSFNYEA